MRHQDRHFGVEIECRTEEGVASEIQRQFSGWHWHHEHCGLEIVSPPLTQRTGFQTLKRVMDFLKPRAEVTNACGQHVHLEASDLSIATVRRFVYSWENNQRHLMQMVAPSRHSNGYASRWQPNELIRLDEIAGTRTVPQCPLDFRYDSYYGTWYLMVDGLRQDQYRWNREQAQIFNTHYPSLRRSLNRGRRGRSGMDMMYDFDRYKTVNVCSLPEHGTIEIRQHHATLEYDEAEAWIKFCMGFLCDVAERKRIIREYKTPENMLRFLKVDKNVRPIINEKLSHAGRIQRAAPEVDDPYETWDTDEDEGYDDDYYEDDPW